MSSRKVPKSRRLLVILLIVIIAAGAVAYFYKDALKTPKTGSNSIVASQGWTKIGNEIMVSSDSSNMTLIVSGGKGLLVDTGNNKDEAQRVKDYLDKNKIVVESIILTDMHNDHTANLKMFINDNVKLYKPLELADGQEIALGAKTLRILKTDGHTTKNNNVSVEIIEDNVLIAGDVVITGGIPAVGGNYKDLIDTLKRIDSKGYSVIVPGQGAIVESKAAVAKNLEYLENAGKKVEELINSGGALPQIESIRIEDCVSGITSQNKELLNEIHRFNLVNIYQQIKMENGK